MNKLEKLDLSLFSVRLWRIAVNLQLPQERKIRASEDEQLESPVFPCLEQYNRDDIEQPESPFFGPFRDRNDYEQPRKPFGKKKKQKMELFSFDGLRDEIDIGTQSQQKPAPYQKVPLRKESPKRPSQKEKTQSPKRPRNFVSNLQKDHQNEPLQSPPRKRIKKYTQMDEEQYSVNSATPVKQKKSKYFDPKPYVMRKIKFYVKKMCPQQTQRDHRLAEEYFRKNINEDFYRKIIFTDYNEFLDKSVMFEEIRHEWTNGKEGSLAPNQKFLSEQKKLFLEEIKRVQLLYTYDTKSIQKTMWNILQLNTEQNMQVRSFTKKNYTQIAEILKNSDKISFEDFWQRISEQLRVKHPQKYDRYAMEKIKQEYFS